MQRTSILASSVLLIMGLGLSSAVSAQTQSSEHMLTSSTDEGIEIYVRERIPEGQSASNLKEAVLFVHGATYPGHTFDVTLPSGPSWMGYIAEAGFATYYLDKRGYGNSTRPEAMSAPSEENEPFARAETVINDIDDAVDFILDRTGAEKVNLVGWSWGTVTTGMYTASNNDRVDRLVLFAPVYAHNNDAWTGNLADPENPDQLADVGAYRTVTRDQADTRWANQIPVETTEWRNPDVFSRWYEQMLAMEPASDPEAVKAPNGVLVDLWEIFNNRPIYDAGDITVPTLVIRGDDDPTSVDADAQGLFHALGSDTARYINIADGTHFINLETHAPQLFGETLHFLQGN